MKVRKALTSLIAASICAALPTGSAAQVLSGVPYDGFREQDYAPNVLENAVLAFCPQVLVNPERSARAFGLYPGQTEDDGGQVYSRTFVLASILVLVYPDEQTCTVLLTDTMSDTNDWRRIIELRLRGDGFELRNPDEPNRLFTKDGSEWRFIFTQDGEDVFFQVLR